MTNTFGITARAYRWYGDGTETGATALAAENTQYTALVLADFPTVLRYGVQESGTGSASGASTDDYQLQYSLNGGAFTNVTSSSTVVQGFTSADLTDAAGTTQRLSAGTGSFITGEIAETDGLLTDWQLTANNHSELLFAIQVMAADTAESDVITFRVLRNGGVFNTYSVTPQITVTTLQQYVLTADSGTFAMTGTSANLEWNRLVAAASGSFSMAGTDANLEHAHLVAAGSGSFVMTGQDATLIYEQGDPVLAADSGAFAMTGAAASLEWSRLVAAATGAFMMAGQSASLEWGHEVAAESGVFTMNGTAANLEWLRVAPADSGSFVMTGQAASLEWSRLVAAASGAFTMTGQDATLTYGSSGDYTLVADSGSFVFTGQAATLTYAERAEPNHHPRRHASAFGHPSRVGKFGRPKRLGRTRG